MSYFIYSSSKALVRNSRMLSQYPAQYILPLQDSAGHWETAIARFHTKDSAKSLQTQHAHFVWVSLVSWYCISIRTRGGIYGQIYPSPEEIPEGKAEGTPKVEGGIFYCIS